MHRTHYRCQFTLDPPWSMLQEAADLGQHTSCYENFDCVTVTSGIAGRQTGKIQRSNPSCFELCACKLQWWANKCRQLTCEQSAWEFKCHYCIRNLRLPATAISLTFTSHVWIFDMRLIIRHTTQTPWQLPVDLALIHFATCFFCHKETDTFSAAESHFICRAHAVGIPPLLVKMDWQ